jgi:hypothetical protein
VLFHIPDLLLVFAEGVAATRRPVFFRYLFSSSSFFNILALTNTPAMFDSPLFETLIALVLIYALLSIFVSILTEWVNHMKKSRGVLLQKAITAMLDKAQQTELAKLLYTHPLIGWNGATKALPDYITSGTFADVLIDVVGQLPQKNADGTVTPAAQATATSDPLARFKASIDAMTDGELKKLLLFFYERSKNDKSGMYELGLLREHIIAWYDERMAKLTGTFKALTRYRTLIWGFVVAIGLNVDSINLVRTFMQDSNLREEVVGDATVMAGVWKRSSDSLFTVKISKVLDSITAYKGAKDTTAKASELNYALRGLEKLKKVSDSLGSKKLSEGSQALGLLDSYNIPIGWDSDAAPISWLPRNREMRENHRKELAQVQGAYIDVHNNCPTWVSWLLYIAGIIISGFSLSYGAPFWFDLLVKLVNLRRSGIRPEDKTK